MTISPMAMADEANVEGTHAEEGSHEGKSHEEGAHESHRHHMALILGNTQSEETSNGPSIGVDYEYRLNKWLGIGGLVEWAGGDFDHLLLMVPLYIHPYKGWLFNASLGTEIHKEHGNHDEEEKTRDWIVRTGVAYQFPIGARYTIAPALNVDFSAHETTIAYGLAFGVGF
jgi:hypothetical protein